MFVFPFGKGGLQTFAKQFMRLFCQLMPPPLCLPPRLQQLCGKYVVMYAKILILLNLLVFALLASQPLFYLLALGITQKRLQAPAYIELRQRLDKNLQPRLGLVYYASLALVISLIVVSFSQGLPVVLATSLIALAALLADVVLAVKTNIPINRLINQWSADNYPRHWQLIRRKWFYFYHFRQAAGLTGLASLLVGAVFG